MDDAVRPPLADRHLQRVQHQFGPQMVGHRPADNLAAPGIQNYCEIEKTAAVGTKVMSATQSWFGRKALKSRSTRSGAGLTSLFRRVVTRRRLAPINPPARISRAMRLRPCFSPPARSSACTRGAP